jgi:hypothetical protein
MSAGRNAELAGEIVGQLLQVSFEGWFMCRIAVDPDPTNETAGRSGYTMALPGEPPLDQVIRLQPGARTVLREPGPQNGIEIGVKVTDVQFGGAPYEPGLRALGGAAVALEGKNPPFEGPTFDSRNNIVGSDDTMAFVVNPFELVIRGSGVTIRATDHLNPARPEQPIWEIEDPATYARRLPTLIYPSNLAASKLGAFDDYAYFRQRMRYLRGRIEQLEREGHDPTSDAEIQGFRSRLYQMEFWGDRFFNKSQFQLQYSFRINGRQEVEDPAGALCGRADTARPWTTSFWFGSWDGDLLIGWMEGSLGIPFRADGR